MNNKVFGVIVFTTGAVIGSVATWFAIKTKYEQIAQEEIDSVKEEYDRLIKSRKKEIEAVRKVVEANHDSESKEEDEEDNDDDDSNYEQTMIDYNSIASTYKGSDDEENDKEGDDKVEDEVPYINGPYVITPEQFGDEPSYSAQPLDYFADGILADGWGVKLDIEETIGEDALKHFGDYEDDVVYVRNERTEIDYEVTKDPRRYDEAQQLNPYYER